MLARSGATSANDPYSFLKPAMPAADSVRTGPALIALTRIPSGPRSAARYRTAASRAAFATPITL
jgi:hypothetical protein